MNHRDIEEQDLIGRYRRGDLAPGVEELFEAHLIECSTCQDILELDAEFGASLRHAAVEEAARTVVDLGWLGWLVKTRRRAIAAMGTGLLPIVVVAFLGGTYAGGRKTALLSEPPARVAAQPLINLPSYLLSTTRDLHGPVVIELRADAEWLELTFEVDGGEESYEAILTSGEKLVWRGEEIIPDRWDVLRITFPASLLSAGKYRLELFSGESGTSFRVEVRAPRLDR